MSEQIKISVIIPTIQKNLSVLNKLLQILSFDKTVSEIIIINNIKEQFVPEVKSKKIKVYQPDYNFYVNESWNFGVSICENERFLIINDDILPCENFCTRIINTGILEKEDTGLVGICNRFINQNPRDTKTLNKPVCNNTTEITFEELPSHMGTGDWGSAFFGKKQNYYIIPNDIKIIFGDNYILYKNIKNNKKNLAMCGLPFNHIHSLSSASEEFSEIIGNDIANQKKYFM